VEGILRVAKRTYEKITKSNPKKAAESRLRRNDVITKSAPPNRKRTLSKKETLRKLSRGETLVRTATRQYRPEEIDHACGGAPLRNREGKDGKKGGKVVGLGKRRDDLTNQKKTAEGNQGETFSLSTLAEGWKGKKKKGGETEGAHEAVPFAARRGKKKSPWAETPSQQKIFGNQEGHEEG